MKVDDAITLEALKAQAKQAGLEVSDSEALELLTGVTRNNQFARSLRELVRPETEPQVIFHAPLSES